MVSIPIISLRSLGAGSESRMSLPGRRQQRPPCHRPMRKENWPASRGCPPSRRRRRRHRHGGKPARRPAVPRRLPTIRAAMPRQRLAAGSRSTQAAFPGQGRAVMEPRHHAVMLSGAKRSRNISYGITRAPSTADRLSANEASRPQRQNSGAARRRAMGRHAETAAHTATIAKPNGIA